MTDYIVASGQQAKHAFVPTANVVDTVTFTDNIGSVEIISDGAAATYYTIGGGTPTVGGGNCFLLPAGVISVDRRALQNGGGPDVVKLISAGAPTLSVQAG